MSGPPGIGILNRGPYNGLPSVGGAPPRGVDGGLPSGKVSAGLRNDVIEPMANATATHPFFIAPMKTFNEIIENDILMVQTSGSGSDNKYTNLGSDYGVFGRPLRLLENTPNSFAEENNPDNEKVYDELEDAIEAARKWRCLGIVVAVGAGHDTDRQLVNVAIRGRIGAPNIFNTTTERVCRGDLLCVTISVKRNDDGYVLEAGTAAIKSTSDLPQTDAEKVFYHVLGTYIRPIAKTNATANSIRSYLSNQTILDRKASYEIALRL